MAQAASALQVSTPAAETAVSEEAMWQRVEQFPCRLTVELRVPLFTVGNLLRLNPGSVIETDWAQSTDVPLVVNKELVGWAEFEVVGEGLAVRVTEFA
jgi:flagellar motor switch/type III secretory pathway protein FliN